jgi:CubicO group peptidase (beta-lactamase class C family)
MMKPGARALLGWILLGNMAMAVAGGKAERRDHVHRAGAPGVAQTVALAELDGELAAVVHDAQHPLAGLSVLAIRDGKVTYQQQFGLRRMATGDVGAVDLPVTPATLFRIASISKMVTAIGAMKLVEDELIDLDTDISAYIGFPVRNPHFPNTPVTLRHLLTHTSSLRDDAGYAWGVDTALKDVLTPGAAQYGKGGIWADNEGPGRYFTYSNLNWSVIGTLMEKVTGERFDRLMKRLVLEPMGIAGGYNVAGFTPQEVDNTATLYRKRGADTATWNPAGPWIAQVDNFSVQAPTPPAGIAAYAVGANGALFSPTGGLRISAPDLGKIMLMLLNKGKYDGKQILKPETVALMASAQWTDNGHNGDTLHGRYRSWGLGMQRFDSVSGLVEGQAFHAVGHLGDAYGLLSVFAADLAHRNGLIALISGTGTAPDSYPGHYSTLMRSEEIILTSLYRRAVLGSKAP